jgi:hypothetical protein
MEIDRDTAKNIIDYIKNDAEILIPAERFFDENGNHLTKKQYGLVLLEFLCEELEEKFIK